VAPHSNPSFNLNSFLTFNNPQWMSHISNKVRTLKEKVGTTIGGSLEKLEFE
jgi:hypothetical protein